MTPRSTSPLHICLRRTVDWGDEPAFRAQLDPAFAPKVNAWNATFPLPYHLFRQELRWIAQANLEKVEGAVLCRWEEVPEGALVAPVDDDDWFAPHLVEVIKAAAGPEVVGLHWQQGVLEVPINSGHRLRLLLRHLLPARKPRWLCATNSYVAASRWFPQQQAGQIRVLPQRLSLHNRSLASITSLNYGRPTITPQQLRRRARAYIRLYRRWQSAPADLTWSRPACIRWKS